MALKDCKIGPAAAVSNIDRAREFYEGKLGLEPSPMGDSMVSYSCGADTGLMVYVSDYAGSNRATLAGFEVPDFDAAFSELRDRGVAFERYDFDEMDDEGVLHAGDFRVAFFADPDGNIFTING